MGHKPWHDGEKTPCQEYHRLMSSVRPLLFTFAKCDSICLNSLGGGMWHVLGLHRVSPCFRQLGRAMFMWTSWQLPCFVTGDVWLSQEFRIVRCRLAAPTFEHLYLIGWSYSKLSFMEATNVVPTQKTQRERDPETPPKKKTAVRFRQSEFISAVFFEKTLHLNGVFCIPEKTFFGFYDFKNRQSPRDFLAHFVAVSTFGIDDNVCCGWKKNSCTFFPPFIGATHVTACVTIQ